MMTRQHGHRERRRRRCWKCTSGGCTTRGSTASVERNIATLQELPPTGSAKDFKDRVADKITAWSGSMTFVVLHVAWFAAWVAITPAGRRCGASTLPVPRC